MKPNEDRRTLISSEISEQISFGISAKDSSHIMRILRDQLYTDQVLAVLREYSTNALDANRQANRANVPIEIDLPTEFQPYLAIRDSGPGLSQTDVFNIYTQYGMSTKRDTNELIGMLGIGSKSAFSYASAFTITSYFGGNKTIYNATLDERDIGIIQLLSKTPCKPNQTGIEIKIPVRAYDINRFYMHASELFAFFNPKPKFNVDIRFRDYNLKTSPSGFIKKSNNNPTIVMGCIPYTISSSYMEEICNDLNELGVYLRSVGLFVEIGSVDISANRESLKHTNKTKLAIREKFKKFQDEIKTELQAIIDDNQISGWQKRLKCLKFAEELSLNGIKLLHSVNFDTDYIKEFENLKSCKVLNSAGHILHQPRVMIPQTSYMYAKDSAIIICDTNKKVTNYIIPLAQFFIKPISKNITIDEVEQEVTAVLKKLQYEGLPIKKLSSFQENYKAKNRKNNIKHHKNTFIYNFSAKREPLSGLWDIIDHAPSSSDVFVVMSRFCPEGFDTKYPAQFEADRRILQLANIKFPQIIGYKSTEAKPIDAKDCLGTPYSKWIYSSLKEITTNKNFKKSYDESIWMLHRNLYSNDLLEFIYKEFIKCNVNEKNLLFRYIKELMNMKYSYTNYPGRYKFPFAYKAKPDLLLKEINNRYPLWAQYGSIHKLYNNNTKNWVQYMNLIDGAQI